MQLLLVYVPVNDNPYTSTLDETDKIVHISQNSKHVSQNQLFAKADMAKPSGKNTHTFPTQV